MVNLLQITSFFSSIIVGSFYVHLNPILYYYAIFVTDNLAVFNIVVLKHAEETELKSTQNQTNSIPVPIEKLRQQKIEKC